MDIPTVKIENFQKRYMVILADRRLARIFTIYLGIFEDEGEYIDLEDVPQKVKAVDSRQGKIERHIKTHLKKHLQNIGKRALQFLIERKIKQLDGVFIGTHHELFLDIKNNLPPRLRNKVIGEFVVDVDKPVGEATSEIIFRFNL